MKKVIGITISLVGILMLIGTIVYQVTTESNAAYMIPIGLLFSFIGVFYMIKSAKSNDK